MQKYNHGAASLRANAKANNTYGRTSVTVKKTTQDNKTTIGKLRNKVYYKYAKSQIVKHNGA